MGIYVQPPLYEVPSAWALPNLRELPSWWGAKRVAIDLETCDPTLTTLGPGVRRGGYIVGVAFAIEDGPSAYLPIGHASGENLEREHVLAYLADQARDFWGEIVGANLPYDLDYLAQAGIWFGKASFFRDVQVAEPLLDELQLSYSLDSIAQAHGFAGKSEGHLSRAATAYGVDAKRDIYRLPARHVGAYAEQDVRLPLQLIARQEALIDEQGLRNVYDLESRCLPILLQMRRRGVRVNLDRLEQVRAWATEQVEEALIPVRTTTGIRIGGEDVMKAKLLAQALAAIGIQVPTTPTGLPSVKAPWLSKIMHPVAQALVRARHFDKIRNTFANSIQRHQVNGRVHCTFNQLRTQKGEDDLKGAAYGRISCADPNLQQQPSRDEEIAPRWRAVYEPDEGMLWCAADYSQQEPRWAVHYAVLAACSGAEDFAGLYRANPEEDCYDLISRAASIKRKDAKIIFLALCYGMGGGKLCRSLGLPTVMKSDPNWNGGVPFEAAGPEGEALFKLFHERVPFVKPLSKAVAKRAEARGFIRTHSGRRCRFPWNPRRREYDWTFKALNRLIQGSSADHTKTAMVALDAAGFKLQLQIHDEIDLSVRSPEEAAEVGRIMKECIPLQVPMKVGVEVGPTWGEVE